MLNKYYTNKSQSAAAALEYWSVICLHIKQNNSVSGMHKGLHRWYAVDLIGLLFAI